MSIRRQLGDLAKSLDSSAVGSFLSKGASEADFTTISYSDVSGTPSVVADSAIATSIIDSAYVSSRVITVAAGLDSATTINLLDSNYMAARSGGGAGFYVYNYDATAGQTTFQDSDAAGNVMSYSADGIIVFYNGVMLPTADYTATDGTSVVLGSAADSQDVLTIAKWSVGGGGSSGAAWYGDRAITAGGYQFGNVTESRIEYFDITTTGNATQFGDLSSVARGVNAVSNGTYAVFQTAVNGDYNPNTNYYEYVTVSTTGNASDFGDAVSGAAVARMQQSCADGTYGIFAGGYTDTMLNVIQYITVATPSNATDFGDMATARYLGAGCNDATRGLFGAGGTASGKTSNIEYITMATTGNGTSFGNLSSARNYLGAASDDTYAVFGGGDTGSFVNVMDYVTIQTTSNSTDFGDLTQSVSGPSGTSNNSRGVFMGGNISGASLSSTNTIEYITISTAANAADFGDMFYASYQHGTTSGSPS